MPAASSLTQDLPGVSLGAKLYQAVFVPGPRAVCVFRLSQWAAGHGLRPVAALVQDLNCFLHSCDLSYAASVGPGLRLPHPVGVVLGTCAAGAELTLGPNTTIGNRGDHEVDGRCTPLLRDRVTVNAGAVVIGPVTLGDGVVVGANAVVTRDLAAGTVAVGAPARPLRGGHYRAEGASPSPAGSWDRSSSRAVSSG